MKLNKILLYFVLSLVLAIAGCGTEGQKTAIETQQPTLSPTHTAQPTETPKPTKAPEIIVATKPAKEPEAKPTKAPKPVATEIPAPTQAVIPESINELYCDLDVNCRQAWQNIDLLPEEKREVVPKDGVILSLKNIEFQDGESVFDVLKRELYNKKIHFEFVKTPVYNSAYIEGISNLYEFDMGEYSGWMYRVNGEKPSYGSSQYILKNGDKIEVYYSINYLEDKK